MVRNIVQKRLPGRPRAFEPKAALDRAVEMFWAHGYQGVNVDRIARAVGVTKPCLYREFGDKPSLLVEAVKRYAETYGARVIAAFQAEAEIGRAVTAFCETAVTTATADSRTGCLMACAVLGESERVSDIREFFIRGLAASADILAERFEKEIKEKRLSGKIPAKVRGRILIDATQGILLRARAGASRKELLADARSYVPLVLG